MADETIEKSSTGPLETPEYKGKWKKFVDDATSKPGHEAKGVDWADGRKAVLTPEVELEPSE